MLYIGGNGSVLVVAGVVMNFTNILPQRFNNKRYEDHNYHDNSINYCEDVVCLTNQTHSVSSACKHIVTECCWGAMTIHKLPCIIIHTCLHAYIDV